MRVLLGKRRRPRTGMKRAMGKPFRGYVEEAEERYAYLRELVLRTAPPPADLVDLGAAPGDQSLAFAALGFRVTAVDLGAAEWSDEPSGSLEQRLAAGGVAFVRCDLDKTPYPLADASFDVAVLTEVLEHLREYPLRSLQEIARTLRPGGALVLTTPNAAYVRNRVNLALGRTVHTPLNDWLYGEPHARHAREYTVRELDTLLRRAELEPVLVAGRHFYRAAGNQTRTARAAKRLVDRVARRAPTLGPSLVVVARRPL